MNGILIICEGKHDVSYISLLLELIGFKEYKRNINDFEQPLKSLFSNHIKNFNYDNNRLRKGPNLPIIYRQPKKNRQFAIIYAIDGIRNIDKAKDVISRYRTAIEYGKINEKFEINLSLCLILDADDIGVKGRIKEVVIEYNDTIMNINNLQHSVVIEEEEYKAFGSFIISKDDDKGNLEDIIIPALLRNSAQKTKINDAKNYLEKNSFIRVKKKSNKPPIDDLKKTKSDLNKSLIAISGQFEFSGLDNGETIRKNKLLKGLLVDDSKSKEIIVFLKKLLKAAKS